MSVQPADVLAFLGRSGSTESTAQIGMHIEVVTAMVRAYVRDNGFDPDTGWPSDDLAAVIVSATARQQSNPTHTVQVSVDDGAVSQGMFKGWTLPELAILHRYRLRAQ